MLSVIVCQVPCRAESLNSNDVFVLFSPSAVFIWAGKVRVAPGVSPRRPGRLAPPPRAHGPEPGRLAPWLLQFHVVMLLLVYSSLVYNLPYAGLVSRTRWFDCLLCRAAPETSGKWPRILQAFHPGTENKQTYFLSVLPLYRAVEESSIYF